MNKIIKPTFEEAFTEWKHTTGKECSYKSWIKPKFNFWKLRFEYYFYYKPLGYKTEAEIYDELFTIGLN